MRGIRNNEANRRKEGEKAPHHISLLSNSHRETLELTVRME